MKELQIAREFQTSQGPVREALRELEALRLVESETYRGTRVRAIGPEERRETGEVRGVLEQAAALKATRLKGNVAPLRTELNAIREAAAAGDLDAYSRRNTAFHRRIVEAGGNAVLLRVWDSLMLEVRTRIGLNELTLDLRAVAETHVPILDALERGDGALAGELLREHAAMFIPDPERPGDALELPHSGLVPARDAGAPDRGRRPATEDPAQGGARAEHQ